MKTMEINGKTITTNYGKEGGYSICDGNDKKNRTMELKKDFRETSGEMLERLAQYYNHIVFYNCTTAVRGYYDIIAYCK